MQGKEFVIQGGFWVFGQSQPYKAGRDNRIVPSQRNSELWPPTSRWYIPGHYPPPTSHSIVTSHTGWGTEKCHFWNSQLPLFMIILSILPTPVLSSAKFPWTILYNWLVFFHHITWASSGTNSVTLKMEAERSSKTAEHLSLHSAETRRQSSSAQLPWKPAQVRQITRIKHKQHSSKSCVSRYFMTLTTEYRDWGQEMLAIIRCRIFCLPGYYPKM